MPGLPKITFSLDATQETVHAVVGERSANFTLADGRVLFAKWGPWHDPNFANLLEWYEAEQDFIVPITVPFDSIVSIEIL